MKIDVKMICHPENAPHMQWSVSSELLGCSGFAATPEEAYRAYRDALAERGALQEA